MSSVLRHNCLIATGMVLLSLSGVADAGGPAGDTPSLPQLLKSAEASDPWPKADALCRYNAAKWMNREPHALRTWDSNYVSLATLGPVEEFLNTTGIKAIRAGKPADSFLVPDKAIEWQSDLHDFPLNLGSLQAKHKMAGEVFTPLLLDHWRILRASFIPHDQVKELNLQIFFRMMDIVSSVPQSALRAEITKNIIAGGYHLDRRAPGQDKNLDVFTFHFPCTVVSVLVSYDNANFIEQAVGHPLQASALTFDPDQRSMLAGEVVSGTRFKHFAPADLTAVSITQASQIPMGKETEPYTQRYLLGKTVHDAGMSPAEVHAEEHKEKEATQRDIINNAPNFQHFVNDQVLPLLQKMAHTYPEIYGKFLELRQWWGRMTGHGGTE